MEALLSIADYDEPEPAPVLVQAPAAVGVTYVEIRWWARWLEIFTASDLADAMGVDVSVGEKGIKALLWHGLVEDTGEFLEGPFGLLERVVEYKDPRLLPGPKLHPVQTPPEKLVGYTEVLCVRGLPIRLIDNTERRNMMQGTGGGRIRMKLKDARFDAMQQAKMDRAEADRIRRRKALESGGPKSKKLRYAHKSKKRPDNPNKS